ncbi:MAG: hypothetical protein E7631_11370 [Ruminococcaceae bacterium]|nr:hypothetical protein [Oscillospiraceae bacterium]
MIRGCQKRVYYLKNPNSPLFAEAYFILKGEKTPAPKETEMAEEARRIVENFENPGSRKPYPSPPFCAGQKIGAFMVGAASSSAVIGGIALLLAFA